MLRRSCDSGQRPHAEADDADVASCGGLRNTGKHLPNRTASMEVALRFRAARPVEALHTVQRRAMKDEAVATPLVDAYPIHPEERACRVDHASEWTRGQCAGQQDHPDRCREPDPMTLLAERHQCRHGRSKNEKARHRSEPVVDQHRRRDRRSNPERHRDIR